MTFYRQVTGARGSASRRHERSNHPRDPQRRAAQYAKKMGLTHAQCWAHARRNVFEAQDIEPGPAVEALDAIGALYVVEVAIREQALPGPAKRAYRLAQTGPVAERFFVWIDKRFAALNSDF